jgi:epoxyqueuosine reductase
VDQGRAERDFIAHSPHNSLQNAADEKAFGKPLVGFARGDDPLFEAYREHVGPFYITPWELFAITFGTRMCVPII